MAESRRAAPLTGLAVAWGGTLLLVSPPALALGEPGSVAAAFVGQLAFWLIGAIVMAIVWFWEKESLSSLWLQPLQWQSFAWGLLLVVVMIFLIGPAVDRARRAAGLAGFEQGMETLAAFPAWLRIVMAVTAGVVEEILFRGYAVTRLLRLTGSLWLAGLVAAVVFGLLHYPVWGSGPTFGWLIGAVFSVAFFIWRRDLLAMIVAHVIVDVNGIVVQPMFGEWWKEG